MDFTDRYSAGVLDNLRETVRSSLLKLPAMGHFGWATSLEGPVVKC